MCILDSTALSSRRFQIWDINLHHYHEEEELEKELDAEVVAERTIGARLEEEEEGDEGDIFEEIEDAHSMLESAALTVQKFWRGHQVGIKGCATGGSDWSTRVTTTMC